MTYFVYEADGVKGYVLVRELSDQTAAIDDLGVDHASKRQGIGRQLVEYAIDWAKQRGLTSIKLITQTNNAAAAATYRSAGFDEISGEYLNFEKTL